VTVLYQVLNKQVPVVVQVPVPVPSTTRLHSELTPQSSLISAALALPLGMSEYVLLVI